MTDQSTLKPRRGVVDSRELRSGLPPIGLATVAAVAGLVILLAFAQLSWISEEEAAPIGVQIFDQGGLRDLFVMLVIPLGAILALIAAMPVFIKGLGARLIKRLQHEKPTMNLRLTRIAGALILFGVGYFILFNGQIYRGLLDALQAMGIGFWVAFIAGWTLFTLRRYAPVDLLFQPEEHEAPPEQQRIPDDATYRRILGIRNLRAGVWRGLFLTASGFGLIALVILLASILNQAFGYVLVNYQVKPSDLSSVPLENLDEAGLATVIEEKIAVGILRRVVRDNLIPASRTQSETWTSEPISQLFEGKLIAPGLEGKAFNELEKSDLVDMLEVNLDTNQLREIIIRDIARPRYDLSWNLYESLTQRERIEAEAKARFPEGELRWHNWLSLDFVGRGLTAEPATTGLRTSLIGSIWIIVLTIIIALPLGVGAAIYLEEYAQKNFFNSIIETNIRNLAGVPSIIYGMLGLAVFVRALEELSSGRFVGITDSNGRTVISAAFTMSLLILPVIIINAQEAIRAVPASIREASYGVGATKWQTIQRQVMPAAFPGVITGLILSVSRAVGETAPLLVVGGLTFMTIDPNGPFSKFSVVPIQVYSWTSDANQRFKNVAAAAIIVLLIVLLILNTVAIVTRQRLSKRLRG
ncbi:MAG: hypothetical protein OHK0023_16850 [Anaerolineae bacterium]